MSDSIGWQRFEEGTGINEAGTEEFRKAWEKLLTNPGRITLPPPVLTNSDLDKIRQIMREELEHATSLTCMAGECKERSTRLLLHFLKHVGFVRVPLCEQHYQLSEKRDV